MATSQFNTLNQIIKAYEDIASRHQQVHSFGVGDNWEVGVSEALTHPSLWVNPINADMPKTDNGYSSYSVDFEIKIFDLVNKDESNENEVLSDSFEILKDIINEFNTHPFFIDSDFTIEGDINFSSFTERFDEEVSGWEATFTIMSPNRRSFCSSPIDPISGYNFVPNSVTVNDAENPSSPIELYLGDDYTCEATTPRDGIAYQRPQITGELTSFITGDDAWHLMNGTYDYTPPVYPISYARLDYGSIDPFLTLIDNNSFGNKNRFTDEFGGQTYTNNYVIDHLTGLGWYKGYKYGIGSGLSWQNMITNINNNTDFGYSDWRMPNKNEMNSLMNTGLPPGRVDPFDYSPFNVVQNYYFWTSTTYYVTGRALAAYIGCQFIYKIKSETTHSSFMCRNHFV